jgi:hypothetical protein
VEFKKMCVDVFVNCVNKQPPTEAGLGVIEVETYGFITAFDILQRKSTYSWQRFQQLLSTFKTLLCFPPVPYQVGFSNEKG